MRRESRQMHTQTSHAKHENSPVGPGFLLQESVIVAIVATATSRGHMCSRRKVPSMKTSSICSSIQSGLSSACSSEHGFSDRRGGDGTTVSSAPAIIAEREYPSSGRNPSAPQSLGASSGPLGPVPGPVRAWTYAGSGSPGLRPRLQGLGLVHVSYVLAQG